MKTFIKILRYLFSPLIILPLLIILFLGIPSAATTKTLTERENLKKILELSGVYDNLTNISIEIAISSGQFEGFGDMTDKYIKMLEDDNSEIRESLDSVLTSEQIQKKTEIAIEAFYDWFEGKTSLPEFDIYLIDSNEAAKDLMISLYVSEAESLPVCGDYTDPIPNSDPLGISCIPVGVSIDEFRSYAEEQITTEDMSDLKESIRINSDSLNITAETTEQVQAFFLIAKNMYIIMSVVALLLSVILIFLIPGIKTGLIITGITHLLASLYLFVISSVKNIDVILSNLIVQNQLESSNQEYLEELVENVLKELYRVVSEQIKIFTLAIASLGLFLTVLGFLLKKKKTDVENTNAEVTSTANQKTVNEKK